jgi:UDP-3-O-[3-hydroxymyristoyl] glucosamine N-acyltransferase
MLKRLLRHLAFEHGRGLWLYRRVCKPWGPEWAAWLKRRGVFHAQGERCSIHPNVTFTDPRYVRMGSNVRLSGCTLFGHDGSVNMINAAYGLHLDRVGKIDIGDDVFIGHGAIVLPGVTIGSRVVIGAGAVVARDVPPNSVMVGSPARRVSSLDDLAARYLRESAASPWAHVFARTEAGFDAALEPELVARRAAHFFAGPPAAAG